MNYRRMVQCGAISCLIALSLPQAVAAEHESQSNRETEACSADHSRDDRHEASERDRAHEHDSDDDDDCVITPPAEVAEAPMALLLPASAVLTGGAGVVLLRRRARVGRTSKA